MLLDEAAEANVSGLCEPLSLDDVEFATLEWVDWLGNARLLEPIGYVPPAEFEQAYYTHAAATEEEERLKQASLH
jgi:hypothetical protein